jgi:hypothetical protein
VSANDSFSPDVVVFQPRGELPHLDNFYYTVLRFIASEQVKRGISTLEVLGALVLDNFYYTVLRFIVSEQVKRGISTLEVLGALANMQHDIMIKSENGELMLTRVDLMPLWTA